MDDSISSFDIDVYAARYHGRGKIQRLRFIASRAPSLAADALRTAIIEARKGRDTVMYKDVILQASNLQLGNEFALDAIWVRDCDQWAATELEKLRQDIDERKQQQNKEMIRCGHESLGKFFHERGKLHPARGEYIKTRDYCMQPQHNLHMSEQVIAISIESGDYAHVEGNYLFAENIPDVDKTSPKMSKMRACSGLAFLLRGSYANAADRFLCTNVEAREDRIASLQHDFGDVMSLEDVATYGALCALATMDRPALTQQVIERPEFRNLLELVPDIRETVLDFYNNRYTRCLATMQKIRPDLMLDMYLGVENHVDHLYKKIRRKAMVQYVSPFITADLTRMVTVFNTTDDELKRELLDLIESGNINARIDTQRNALHAKRVNPRDAALRSAIDRGKDAFDDAEAMLLRMMLMKNRLEINGDDAQESSLGPRGQSLNSVADSIFV